MGVVCGVFSLGSDCARTGRTKSLTMRIALLILICGLAAGVYGKSCVGQCGIDDGNHNTCQCNSLCETYGDCCDDFFTVCKSCKGRCGETYNHKNPCHCNDECASHGNCCPDYNQECGGVTGGPSLLSCVGRCGEHFDPSKPCSCTTACSSHNDCCSDYDDVCGGGGDGGATDGELRALTEQLWAADVNSVGDQITVNDQGQCSGNSDLASDPLLTVPESALSGPTLAALVALQDNYIASVNFDEDETPEELTEKENFLDLIMATEVMNITETFMHAKGLITRPLREVIDEIWFTPYSRSGGHMSSTGFEHSFVGEIKNGAVSGFHNWVHFQTEEKSGELNYKCWLKAPVDLGTEGEVFMLKFDWLSEPKSIGSMWIGTTPELELAAYTVCFYARVDSLCPITMNGNNFHVQTWTMSSNGKTLVGSAYPDIDK